MVTNPDFFKYEELENGTIEITGYEGEIPQEGIDIPEEIDGKRVVSIGSYIFQKRFRITQNEKCKKRVIRKITIPNSVTKIKDYAFYQIGLKYITIGNSVTDIGEKSFFGNELFEVGIPKSAKKIGNQAFSNNNIFKINFLGDDKKIDIAEDAFWDNAY